MLGSSSNVLALLPPPREEPSWRLFLFVVIAELLPFLFGYSIGYTSPNFADCDAGNAEAMNCELHLSTEQKSLFGAIICIGAMVGALAGGPMLDPSGRKAGMIASALLYTLGWFCIAAAPAPHSGATEASTGLLVALFMGRILSGVGIGFTCCVVNIYISELAPVALRGALGTLFQVNVVAGLVGSYFLGVFLAWRAMAWLVAILSAIVTVLLLLVPESPQLLLQKGRRTDAEEALRTLRSEDTPLGSVLESWEMATVAEEHLEGASVLQELRRPVAIKTLIAGTGLAVLQQFSGINSVVFYCGEIFSTVFDKKTADAAALGVQVLNLVMTAATIPLMDRAGRRPLLLLSGGIMALSSFLFGLYYALENGEHSLPKGFAVAMIYSYQFAFSLGMGSIPWLIIGEIFPTSIKGVCSSITSAVNWGSSFIVTKTVVNLKEAVGYTGMFWMYAGFLLVGQVFIYFFVPETKGKSLAEIQAALDARSGREYVAVPTSAHPTDA